MKKIISAALIFSMILLSVWCLGLVQAVPTTYTIVPLPPLSNRNVFYGGSAMDIKFQLVDSSGNLVTDATATLTVNGAPAIGSGPSKGTSSFDLQQNTYVFKLATRSYPAGTGSGLNILVITAKIGTTTVTAEFDVAFH